MVDEITHRDIYLKCINDIYDISEEESGYAELKSRPLQEYQRIIALCYESYIDNDKEPDMKMIRKAIEMSIRILTKIRDVMQDKDDKGRIIELLFVLEGMKDVSFLKRKLPIINYDKVIE